MRNLPQPDRDSSAQVLQTALSPYKYRKQMLGYSATSSEINEVVALYDAYDAAEGKAKAEFSAPAMAASLRQALHDAYDQTQKSRRLKNLRSQLFQGVEVCPVCGIDRPSELDHILPRSIYPALSIYVRNLVPVCHACNQQKLAGFADPEELGFLHTYFDLLPEAQFLSCSVQLVGDALVTHFWIDESVFSAGDLPARVSNVCAKLHLNERYRAEVIVYLMSLSPSLHAVFEAGCADAVKRLLFAQAKHESSNFYRNHWRPTLLNALADHTDFCEGGFRIALAVSADVVADFGSAFRAEPASSR